MTHTLASVWLKRKLTSAQAKSKTTNSIFAMPVVRSIVFFIYARLNAVIPFFCANNAFLVGNVGTRCD